MTKPLQDRLEKGLAPFNGDCVHNLDDLALAEIRRVLRFCVSALQDDFPEIYQYADWHEHDGFVIDAERGSWIALREVLKSDQTLFDARHQDFVVSIAFYPAGFDWLLRFNIDDDELESATGDFDFTAAKEGQLGLLVDSLLAEFPELLTKSRSEGWFDARMGN